MIWHTYQEGKKPTLVFIHGWLNNWTVWKKSREYFHKKGYSTLTLDLRGYGHSAHVQQPYTIKQYAEDIHELIKKKGCKRHIIIGHSMGSIIALTYQLTYKTAEGLILCNGTARSALTKHLPKNAEHPLAKLLNTIENYTPNHTKIKHIDFSKKDIKNLTDIEFLHKAIQTAQIRATIDSFKEMVTFDCHNKLKEIAVPTTVIHSTEDKLFSFELGEELAQKIPHTTLCTISGRHRTTIENTREINQYIDLHLKNSANYRKKGNPLQR